MKKSTTILLLAAVCAMGVYIAVTEIRRAGTARRARGHAALFPDDRVEWIEFTRDDQRIVCRRQNGVWMIEEPYKAPADEAAMARILTELRRYQFGRVITREERIRREAGLGDYGLVRPRITVSMGDGERRRVVHFGRISPVGTMVYLKEDRSDDVIAVETNILTALPATVHELRNRKLVTGRPQAVRRLELQSGSGFISLAQSVDGIWYMRQPVEDRADAARVQSVIEQLDQVHIADFISDAVSDAAPYGLEETGMTVTIGYKDGREDTYRLGRPVGPDRPEIYVLSERDGAVYAVKNSIRDALSITCDQLRYRDIVPLSAARIARIEIREKENNIVLRREDEGWYVITPRKWEADVQRVEVLIAAWTKAQAVEFMSAVSNVLDETGLDEPRFALTFSSKADASSEAADDERCALEAGHPVSGALLPVRLRGDRWIRAVPESLGATVSTNPLYYKNRRLIAAEPRHVRFISIEQDGVEHVARRQSDDTLKIITGTRGMPEAFWQDLAAALSSLEASAFAAYEVQDLAEYGLDQPRLLITVGLSGEDGGIKTIMIGRDIGPEEGYAMMRGRDEVFVLGRACWPFVKQWLEASAVEGVPPHDADGAVP